MFTTFPIRSLLRLQVSAEEVRWREPERRARPPPPLRPHRVDGHRPSVNARDRPGSGPWPAPATGSPVFGTGSGPAADGAGSNTRHPATLLPAQALRGAAHA